MSLIQGGIHLRVDGQKHHLPTKGKLKELVKSNPELLWFYTTSHMGEQFTGPLDKLGENTVLIVVGPDPYTSRRWYANIDRTTKGNLRVT